MTDGSEKQVLKSVCKEQPLRSRGFLSQPGGNLRAKTGNAAETSGDQAQHLSRGARQVSVTPSGRPQDLTVKPRIKPYSLEGE